MRRVFQCPGQAEKRDTWGSRRIACGGELLFQKITEGDAVDEREAGRGQSSRRAGLRVLPAPTDVEIYVVDAPPLLDVIDDLPEPRIAELDSFLRDVDDLRHTMRRDLTLAATAVEAGADDLADWLLLREDGEVRAFQTRALAHLGALDTGHLHPDVLGSEDRQAGRGQAGPSPRRAGRVFPAAPLVAAAAAVLGFLTGVVPSTGGPVQTSPTTSNSALESYAHLTELASSGASPSRLSAAALSFHAALAPLVSQAATDPAAAEKAIALLQTERALIVGAGDASALSAVLAQADALVLRLLAALPHHQIRPAAPVVPTTPSGQHRSGAGSKSSPAAKASPSPSQSAAPKQSPQSSPSSSKSTASPSPSSSGGPIPAPGSLPG